MSNGKDKAALGGADSVLSAPALRGAWRVIAPVAVFLITLATFLPTLNNGFTGWDDTIYTYENPHMGSAQGLIKIWTSHENEQYYPLTFTAYWIQHAFFGDNARGYHAVNVVLHAWNAVLVLALLRRMGLRPPGAIFAALLFGVHPTQVMTGAWIAELKNLLSCMFVLLCMMAWLKSERGKWRWYAVALACYAAALLSKSAVLGLPLALAIMDHFLVGRSAAASLKRLAPMMVVAVASAFVTIAFEQKFVDRGDPDAIPGFLERVQIASAAPWWYLKQLLWPTDLAPVYPFWDVGAGKLMWWIPLAVWLVIGGLFVRACRTRVGDDRAGTLRGWEWWAIAHFVLVLGPTLGLVVYGNMHASYVSDHFLYVACIGPFAIVGLIFQRTLASAAGTPTRVSAVLGAATIIGLLGAAAVAYIPVFKDAHSVWTRAVERSPTNYAANVGLALATYNSASELPQSERPARLREALPLFQKAGQIRPRLADAHAFAGSIQADLGDYADAEATLMKAFEAAPNNARATEAMARVLERTGRIPDALAMFERAVALDPSSSKARMGLAQMYLGYLRHADAEAQLREVVLLRPNYGFAYVGLATAIRGQGRWDEAVQRLREGLALSPEDIPARNLLGLFLAAAPIDSVRNGREAVAIMERLVEETGGANYQILDTLAAAYAEVGRFEDALAACEQAGNLADKAGDVRFIQELIRRATLYEQGRPLRL